MKRSLLLSSLVFVFSVAGCAAAAPAGPTPTPLPCPKTGGVAVGQSREEAFRMMARDMTLDVHVMHDPKGRPYKAEVSFDSAAKDAKVESIHYVFSPPSGVLDALQGRYGKPAGADAGWTFWLLPSCGVRVRYMLASGPGGAIVGEEMWVEPLPKDLAKETKSK